MGDTIKNVLILCTGNSARSILGEALINKLGNGRFQAHSAGSSPAGRVNPNALDLLTYLGHNLDFARSKNWSEFDGPDAPQMDFIFTVCDNAANEACPVWPGHPMTAHWGIPDPAAVTGMGPDAKEAFIIAYGRLHKRIERFMALPFDELDEAGLKAALNEIGQMDV